MRVEQGVGGRRCRCSHGSMLARSGLGRMPSRTVRGRPPRTRGGPRGRMAAMDTDTTEASTDHPDESAFGPVGVIGAGAMGAGIAQVAATGGPPRHARRLDAWRRGGRRRAGSALPSTGSWTRAACPTTTPLRCWHASLQPRRSRSCPSAGSSSRPCPRTSTSSAGSSPTSPTSSRRRRCSRRTRRASTSTTSPPRWPTRSACSDCTSSTRRPSCGSSRWCTASAPRGPSSSTPSRSWTPGARRRCGAARRRASSSTASRAPSTARRSASSRAASPTRRRSTGCSASGAASRWGRSS